MCESAAYVRRKDKEELYLADVVSVVPEGGKIRLTSLLGEQKEIEATIDHIDLLNHKIVLRPTKP
jgi:predicted RNA-binding protein